MISIWNGLLNSLSSPKFLKREGQAADHEPPSKNKKVVGSGDVKDAFENDALSTLTVNKLSIFLRDNGMSVNGMRKAQLIALVKSYFENS